MTTFTALQKVSRAGIVKRRDVSMIAVLVAAAVLCLATSASAAQPWWHVNTVFAPAQHPGQEGTVQVEVSNLGDAPTDGTRAEHQVEAVKDETNGFIKIVVKLPAGLSVSEAEEPVVAEGNGTESARGQGKEFRLLIEHLSKFITVPKLCSFSGQTVTCLYGLPVRPYERVDMIIPVIATPGATPGVSEVSVSGGGAAPVISKRVIAPDASAPSFGVEGYEVTPEEEGGAIDTQAGSHPFQLTTTLALNTQTAQVLKRSAHQEYGSGTEPALAIVPEVQPLTETKDLRFNIPPGLIGDPQALPKCSLATFASELMVQAQRCPGTRSSGSRRRS